MKSRSSFATSKSNRPLGFRRGANYQTDRLPLGRKYPAGSSATKPLLARVNVMVQSFLFLVGCILLVSAFSCNIGDRIVTEELIQDTYDIRDAQERFYHKRARYGLLTELFESGLLDHSLKEGKKNGYIYDLRAEGERYTLTVKPTTQDSPADQEKISLFLDESGVARVSFDPRVIASSESTPLTPK